MTETVRGCGGDSRAPGIAEAISLRAIVAAGILFALAGSPARACILDVSLNSDSPKFPYLFPNWNMIETTIFDTVWCSAADCDGYYEAYVRGLTIQNYGTAVGGAGGDISDIYFCMGCLRSSGGACSANQTMTYAGVWANGKAAWTWSGVMNLNADPCNGGPAGCACIFVWHVFLDVGPCPTNLATVKLGPGFNDVLWLGGVTDSNGCYAPWGEISDPSEKTIVYSVKSTDQEKVAPGDTVDYTIYYARPGNTNLSNVIITDTQPAYTHYILGSGVPAPDFMWDPNPGPPPVLRWTIPPPHPVAGGATGEVRFTLSVDWGNGEGFEPGSGDIAAPEGIRLNNQALVEFEGSSCLFDRVITAPTDTVVRRFLFWKVGDNDVLFAPAYGQSPDEIVYSIFLKNVSKTKIWWNVNLWDTVPSEIDPWAPNCGFYDACVGWTMTPTGCSPAYPGYYFSGGETVLTWTLDMPPQMTLELRWKAIVKQSTPADTTAINRASIMADGKTGIVDGTGHSVWPSNFTHLAPIILRTIYVSYTSLAGNYCMKCRCPGYFIDFFPLNKQTQFELRGLEYSGGGWATDGGVSISIGCLIGDCVTGFPGNGGSCPNGGISGGGIAGCKLERAPAKYDPTAWIGTCPTFPFNHIYKLTSNSPVLWQTMTHIEDSNQDNHTYAPATTLTYTGLMHYMWRRMDNTDESPGYGDSLTLINTSMDANDNYNPNLRTTVHLFKWDFGISSWYYRKTYELDKESAAVDLGCLFIDDGPWRTISSDAKLIVNQSDNIWNTLGCCCGQCADNFGAYMPTSQTGNVVSAVGVGTFYGLVQGFSDNTYCKLLIGNTGSQDASYRVFKYIPINPVAIAPMPSQLNGSSGSWIPATSGVVGWGLATASNPACFTGGVINSSSTSLYKVVLDEGGPLQVYHGKHIYSQYSGGAVMHAADGNQTGAEYWLHHSAITGCGTQVIDVFCKKSNMGINLLSEDGYDSTYTSNGPDQCVSFVALTGPLTTNPRNYVITSLGGGGVVAKFDQCSFTEKGYTAPFLQTGTHYVIIAPPVVFSGQNFWITVVVVDFTGMTDVDYDGTTSFTSTDPDGEIESAPMEGYDYTWAPGGGGDAGVKIFINVTLMQLGTQTLVALDTQDGSITGLTAILVVGADVKLTKRPPLTVAASGDIVPFNICWSNYSSATADYFTITDRVPDDTTYSQDTAANHFCGATNGFGGSTVAYSTTDDSPAAFQTMPAGGTASAVTWLRWTIPAVEVNTTGCVCFKVTVD